MKYFSFSLKQLKIIQTIKNEVNIKNAGKNLYLSQPALSSHIKILEGNISSKILVRKKNKIYLTSEGELVLDYGTKILKLCEEADNAIEYLKKLKKFRLSIGSNQRIGKHMSLKLIDLFSKRYSYAQVHLQICSTKNISWQLINGKMDIGIVQEDQVPRNLYHSLYSTPYFEEKILLIIPKSYKQKYGNTINEKKIYKLNFITLKPYFQERGFMDNNLKRFNIIFKQLKIKLELNSVQAIKNGVGSGLGVSFLSSILVKEELYSKRFQSILIDRMNISERFILVVNLKKSQSYLSEQFYNYCFIILKLNLYNKFLNLS